MSGAWDRFCTLASTSLPVRLGQTVGQGLPKAPPRPTAALWPESQALTLLPFCPPRLSLRAWREDILTWGSVAPSLSLLWTPALHPVHLSGWPPGLPADDLPL